MVAIKGVARVGLVATVTALITMLAILALVMLAIPGGVVVVAILLTAPDAEAFALAALLFCGIILVAPISLGILPALALLLLGRRRSLRWLLLPAGLVVGQWWGYRIAPHLYADVDSAAGLFGLLSGVGGLAAAMIFARWLRRSAS